MFSRKNEALLAVWPNPYLALDGFGNPAGAYPVDPEHNPDRYFIGAEIARVDILDSLQKGDLRSPRQDIFWKFNLDEPSNVPATEYYLQALRSGYIFPANNESAKKAGVEFKSIEDCLYEACKKARGKWQQDYMQECPLRQYEKKSQVLGGNAVNPALDEHSSFTNKKVEEK